MDHHLRIPAWPRAAVVTVVVCLGTVGCSGADSGADTSDAATGGTEAACNALARFANSVEATKQAVQNGRGTQEVSGAVATLKDQYVQVTNALEPVDAKASAAIKSSMGDLNDALTRVPANASGQATTKALQPKIDAVTGSVTDAQTKLDCPTKAASPAS